MRRSGDYKKLQCGARGWTFPVIIRGMGVTIVNRAEWYDYQSCRDLWLTIRRGHQFSFKLHPALADRLGRRWWASKFEARTGLTLQKCFRELVKDYPAKRHRCQGNKKYKTETEGINAAKEQGLDVPKNRVSDVVYFCNECGRYHVGKQKPKPQKAATQVLPVHFIEPYYLATFKYVEQILGGLTIDTAKIRYIDVNRVLAEFQLYGEALHSDEFGNDAYSMVALIIMHLPDHAAYLLEDDHLPNLMSSCVIELEGGRRHDPLEVEKCGEVLWPKDSQIGIRFDADDDAVFTGLYRFD
jgi:hypothetical protein